MKYAVGQISKYPTVLYLRLTMRVVLRWTSFCNFQDTLPPNVSSLIERIYSELEEQYGCKLCAYALAFLTFAKVGVSGGELEDLLSMVNVVLKEVFQYADSIGRLPSHVLGRLLSDLEGLVAQGENGGYQWYHRQLKEAAERKYGYLRVEAHMFLSLIHI